MLAPLAPLVLAGTPPLAVPAPPLLPGVSLFAHAAANNAHRLASTRFEANVTLAFLAQAPARHERSSGALGRSPGAVPM
jgi:hypothetical protein